MTRVELAKQLNLTKAQVYYREKVIGIIGQDYTEKNIELIRNKRNFKKKDRKFLSPVKFEIINLHLKGISNYNIGEITKIHWRQINNTIAEYINNDRCIFVESQMNY